MVTRRHLVATQLRHLSLDALRGYESAARLRSFTLAADELSLTQSAISKQVRSIEDTLGCQLFLRGGRELQLTPQGRVVLQGVQQALAALEDSIGRLLAKERQTIVLTAWPSFVSMWLLPRLARFQAHAPHINVAIDSSESLASLERDGYDLAIRLPREPLASDLAQRLGTEEVFLVAAPPLARTIRTPDDLARATLLVYHDPGNRFPWMSWAQWFTRLGVRQNLEQPTLQFSQYDHAIHAAVQAGGVAIGRTPSVLTALRSGALEVLFPEHRVTALHYYLVFSQRGAQDANVLLLADWIRAELLAERQG